MTERAGKFSSKTNIRSEFPGHVGAWNDLPSCMCCSQALMAVVYRIKSGWTLPGLVKLISEPWSFWWKRRCRFAISHGLFNGDMSLWMRKQTNYHSSVALTVLSLHACRLVSNLWRIYVIWCNMYPLKSRKITRHITKNLNPKQAKNTILYRALLRNIKGSIPPINPIGTVHELGSTMVGLSYISNIIGDGIRFLGQILISVEQTADFFSTPRKAQISNHGNRLPSQFISFSWRSIYEFSGRLWTMIFSIFLYDVKAHWKLMVPSGRHTKNYGKSPFSSWVNPLFLWSWLQ